MDLGHFIHELKRRKVYRAAVAYGIFAWLLAQVASLVLSSFEAPSWIMKWLIISLLAGFPVVLLLSWIFEFSSDGGIQRTDPLQDNSHVDSKSGISLARVALATITLISLLGIIWLILWSPISEVVSLDNRPSIAVLPFADLSPDGVQEYLGDGISESISTMLGRYPELKVIGRRSKLPYKGVDTDPVQIGKELDVNIIVQGSVQRLGDQLRVNTQVIDVSDGSQLWSHKEDSFFDDIFEIQDKIAAKILDTFGDLFALSMDRVKVESAKADPKVYEAYLKGKFHWYQGQFEEAKDYFKQAIAMDSTYAPAYVGLADATSTPAHVGLVPIHESYREAKRLLAKALELDPNSAVGRDLNARILFAYDWEHEKAEAEFLRAIDLDPNYSDVRNVYVQFLVTFARHDEALEQARKAIQIDPNHDWPYASLAHCYVAMNRIEEAISILGEHIQFDRGHLRVGGLYALLNQYDQAIEHMVLQFDLNRDEAISGIIQSTYENDGFESAMNTVAEELVRRVDSGIYIGPLRISHFYALAKNEEKTLAWLERAYETRQSSLVYVVSHPVYKFVRPTERYQRILRKMNIPKDPYLTN